MHSVGVLTDLDAGWVLGKVQLVVVGREAVEATALPDLPGCAKLRLVGTA